MLYEVIEKVIHDSRGHFPVRDVTDRPCDTVLVGTHGRDSSHFQVHYRLMTEDELALYLNLPAHGFKPFTRIDLDRNPCPTVLALGFGSFGYWLDGDDDMLTLHKTASAGFQTAPVNLDENPCPTVMAGGIWGSGIDQYRLLDDGRKPRPRDPGKPPYRVPSMAEIRALPWNGLTVASTFAGGGGSSTGYRMAGLRVLWANEFCGAAQDTYAANMAPHTVLDRRDIREVKAADILAATGLEPGELSVLDGSPPCNSFSMAGNREKDWGKPKEHMGRVQVCDDLFFEFARLVDGVRPKVFVAENVSGLVKGTAKGYFKRILASLKALGYRVEARLLDASWLGVPQARQRIIFVGVREDLGRDPAFPKPLSYRYSVRDAIPWITACVQHRGGFGSKDVAGEPALTVTADHTRFEAEARNAPPVAPSRTKPGAYGVRDLDVDGPCPTVTVASPGNDLAIPRVEPEADMEGTLTGEEWERMGRPGTKSAKYFTLYRPDPDGPCHTITAPGGATVSHPTEKRKFSIAELRRICAFPDDYVLTGSYSEQWARLGHSVPPVMMFHIASAVRDRILSPPGAGSPPY